MFMKLHNPPSGEITKINKAPTPTSPEMLNKLQLQSAANETFSPLPVSTGSELEPFSVFHTGAGAAHSWDDWHKVFRPNNN
jgi:hypothetical protein